jgi:hypothetical protein
MARIAVAISDASTTGALACGWCSDMGFLLWRLPTWLILGNDPVIRISFGCSGCPPRAIHRPRCGHDSATHALAEGLFGPGTRISTLSETFPECGTRLTLGRNSASHSPV